jgi:hypothetical protein
VFAFPITNPDSGCALRGCASDRERSNGQGSASKQQGKKETQTIKKADRPSGTFRFIAEQNRAARAR